MLEPQSLLATYNKYRIYDTQPMTEKVNESVLVVFFWQLSVSPDRDKIFKYVERLRCMKHRVLNP